MPGKQSTKRSHITAMRAAKLWQQGYTYKRIADATGLSLDSIKARIELGERLLSVAPDAKHSAGPQDNATLE